MQPLLYDVTEALFWGHMYFLCLIIFGYAQDKLAKNANLRVIKHFVIVEHPEDILKNGFVGYGFK